MDIFDIHSVKMEKANAMLQYQRFKKLANLFRLVELFLAVVFFSWISIRLPFVIGIFGNYFRLVLSVIVSPIFIFLIGNAIIVTLVVKSGQITGNTSEVDNSETDLYDKIANNVRGEVVNPVIEPEEIVYHDKRIISESKTKPIDDYYYCNENEIKNKSVKPSVSDLDLKIYRRSQSENLMKNECFLDPEKVYGKLRRSETEIRRREVDTPAEKVIDTVDDKLSNEEFQKRIEGFIARQIRFRHEEKLAIVTLS